MKIEFLPNAHRPKEHILRIFDFDMKQARLFSDAIKLVIGEGRTVHLAEFDFIQLVNCNLSLRISGMDIGVITDDDHNFYCKMSVSGYEAMLKLIEPFCQKESRSYAWMYDLDNPIDLLLSAGEHVPYTEEEEDFI